MKSNIPPYFYTTSTGRVSLTPQQPTSYGTPSSATDVIIRSNSRNSFCYTHTYM